MTTPRTAGDLVHTYLKISTDRLREALGDARRNDHEGIHQARVNSAACGPPCARTAPCS